MLALKYFSKPRYCAVIGWQLIAQKCALQSINCIEYGKIYLHCQSLSIFHAYEMGNACFDLGKSRRDVF